MHYKKRKSNFNKNPYINLSKEKTWTNWDEICNKITSVLETIKKQKKIIAVETYQGVHHNELIEGLKQLNPTQLIVSHSATFYEEERIKKITKKDVTDDAIFGYMTRLHMLDLMSDTKTSCLKKELDTIKDGVIVLYGYGASLLVDKADVFIYADMARWEIQQRMKKGQVNGIGVENSNDAFSLQYKRGYFVDWRICDRIKRASYTRWDFYLDTNKPETPKMITAATVQKAVQQATKQPFRVVPYFDPGPWGGQWMKQICDLDKEKINFAWCFDCVPEENSILFRIGEEFIEMPSINIVFFDTINLLGEQVEARFGAEFPIRFDFLDTMDGGNLSLQVHPSTDYIQEKFGMKYTQDESYYFLDAEKDGTVYLGLKSDVDSKSMVEDLQLAQEGENSFDAEKYVNKFPIKKHDHVLIPAGTVHCSGTNGMVLEISSTPYIFTFKLWDWGRMGLDGKPRPINIEHGKNVIRWERDANYAKKHLINQVEKLKEGDGWVEERTGLHCNEFIETRRHWFTQKVTHNTQGNVNVLNLVEGNEVVIESPSGAFEPFVVHYAETFIVPASVGEYTITPYGSSEAKRCGTIKAFVRF